MLMKAVIGRRDDGERALRRLHLDVHAVGKRESDIDRIRQGASVALGDVHVHGFDGLQFGQASHGGGNFCGQCFAFGIGGGGLGGVLSFFGGWRRNRDVDFLRRPER